MPLQKQLIELPFAEGVAQKTKAEHVKPTSLLDLQNGEFDKQGAINARFGFTQIGALEAFGETFETNCHALATYEDELVKFSDRYLWSVGSKVDGIKTSKSWVRKDRVPRCAVRRQDVAAGEGGFNFGGETEFSGVENSDVAFLVNTGVNYRCYVWKDNGDGVTTQSIRSTLFIEQDQAQDVMVLCNVAVKTGSGPTSPRIVATGNKFVIWYVDGTNLRHIELDTDDLPSKWHSDTSHATLGGPDELWDVAPMEGTTDFLLVYQTAAASITGQRLTSSFTVANSATTAQSPINVMTIFGSTTDNFIMVIFEAAGILKNQRSTATFTGTATGNIDTDGYTYHHVGAARINSTSSIVVAAAEESGSTDRFILALKVTNSTGAISGNRHRTRNLLLCSRPWAYGGEAFACVGFDSTILANTTNAADRLQFYYFVVNLDADRFAQTFDSVLARPVANINLGNAQPIRPDNFISHVTTGRGPLAKTRTFAVETINKLFQENGRLLRGNGNTVGYQCFMEDPWQEYNVDDPGTDPEFFRGVYPYSSHAAVPYGRGLFVAGGTPSMYDGCSVAEVGYSWFPEIKISLTTPGGVFAAGETYQYTATYEWRDVHGQLHRSAPAIPQTTGAIPAGGAASIQIEVLCQNLTSKEDQEGGFRPDITISVYRTTNAGGQIFFKVSDPVTPLRNDPLSQTVTLTDVTTDVILTTNGVLDLARIGFAWSPLENIQPPSSTIAELHNDRVWLAGGEDGRTIRYSNPIVPEAGGEALEAPTFHPALSLRIDKGGVITGLKSMDGRLFAFKEDTVFAISGDGFFQDGSGGSLVFDSLPGAVGCIEPRSIAVIPDGIVFQSEKGVYLLTRSLTFSYIGAGAEDEIRRAGNLRGVVVREDRHQVVWVSETQNNQPRLIKYDYLFGQWGFDDLNIADAVPADRLMHIADWRADLLTKTTAVSRVISIPLMLGDKDGLVFYEDTSDYVDDGNDMTFSMTTGWIDLAVVSGFHRIWTLLLTVGWDSGGDLTIEVGYANATSTASYPTTFTDTFTHSHPGSPNTVQQIRIRPSIQKGAAIRLRISAAAPSGLSVIGLAAEIATKRGHTRVRDANIAV